MSQNTNTNVQEQLKAMEAAYKAAEDAVRAKYPHLTIVEGSLTQEKDHPKFGSKRRVTVVCPQCGALCERATSDLHTFTVCATCKAKMPKSGKSKNGLALKSQIEELRAKLAMETAGVKTPEPEAPASEKPGSEKPGRKSGSRKGDGADPVK